MKQPVEYRLSGYYNEIQNQLERHRIIDSKANLDNFSISDERKFQQVHRTWVEEELKNDQLRRIRLWSEVIAIGNEDFIEDVHRQLKVKTLGNKAVTCGGKTVLNKPRSPYSKLSDGKKRTLSHENT